MNEELTAQEIKNIRKRYGLSQQAFARVLGIGDATIARYENGAKPTRAMANLIRAAKDESFMLDCLQRDGHRIAESQREQAERLIYTEVSFNEESEVMDINEIYSLTLEKELLNEQAAEILADLFRMKKNALDAGRPEEAVIYNDLIHEVSLAKFSITTSACGTKSALERISGKIRGLMDFANLHFAKAS